MAESVIHVHRGGKLVALVGNPNCGKTALFNLLTGSRQKVANYAGVTVERKEGRLLTAGGKALRLLDLPGTYSLHPRSPDERVTCDVLAGRAKGEKRPDLVVCVLDATNLRRNLRLLLAVRRMGLPIVVALNMADLAARRGLKVDAAALSAQLGLPVVRTSPDHGTAYGLAGQFKADETSFREALYLADEIFMSGTAAEITPVRSVDGIQVGIGRCGPITKRVQQAFFGLFNGQTDDRFGWLDVVNP